MSDVLADSVVVIERQDEEYDGRASPADSIARSRPDKGPGRSFGCWRADGGDIVGAGFITAGLRSTINMVPENVRW